LNDSRTEQDWLDAVRAQVFRAGPDQALELLARGMAVHPDSADLKRLEAGILQHMARDDEAETRLVALLDRDNGDATTAFALARLHLSHARTAAAAAVLRACCDDAANRENAELAIAVIELLDDCGRKRDAAAVATAAIAGNPADPRLHAYAGMLDVQLGAFESARRHYLLALAHDEHAWEWHVPIGLSLTHHYRDAMHPDLTRMRARLEAGGLSDLARAELHFALGKAADDRGDYAQAAAAFRRGNAIRRKMADWSQDEWQQRVDERLARKPLSIRNEQAPGGFVPVFIVGMPRTGTTLLADRLGRYAGVCNRGELPILARLAERQRLAPPKDVGAALAQAAAEYAMHARQDDAAEARWFIDKQPLNFRYLDLALAMFPNARVIHCMRDPRDTALSLWRQCFMEPVNDYAYDFDNIAAVMRDECRLMHHWQKHFGEAIHTVRYEDQVADIDGVVAELDAWLGLPAAERAAPVRETTISTASLWQARQPVYTHAVGHWRRYVEYVPELATCTLGR
jgi:tetratricopeptide (TPR) repeat protein